MRCLLQVLLSERLFEGTQEVKASSRNSSRHACASLTTITHGFCLTSISSYEMTQRLLLIDLPHKDTKINSSRFVNTTVE